MGIASKYGIEVWRWRNGKWVAKHRDGSKDFRTAAEMSNISGRRTGDWLVERNRSGRGTYIPKDDMHPTGTLWHFDGMEWHSIYRRSKGNKRPVYLDDLKDVAEKGDILVESGDAGELTAYDKHGINYSYRYEAAAVFDEHSNMERAHSPHDDPNATTTEDTAIRQGAEVDKVITVLQNLKKMGGEWAGYKPGDTISQTMAKVAIKALEEANPSPTPGTTAINDYVNLANDLDSAGINGDFRAQDIDSTGSADTDAISNIAYCKIVGEAMAGAGAVVDGVIQLRKLINTKNLAPGTDTGKAQFDGERKTALMDYEQDVIKGVGNLFTATSKVITLVDDASKAAQATSTVATIAIAPAMTLVNIVTFARHVRKAHRARRRWWYYRKLLKECDIYPYHDDLQGCMKFLVGKSKRKLRTQASTATAAIVSTGGSGVLTVTAIAGGANAWNPVGWTLLGVAAVGGAGIVGYKVYKRYKREKRHAKRIIKYNGVTSANTAAQQLIRIHNDTSENYGDRDKDAASLILDTFGVNVKGLATPNGRSAAEAMVVRHLS